MGDIIMGNNFNKMIYWMDCYVAKKIEVHAENVFVQ